MDPITHTFFGAALAGTRLGKASWGATATLLIGANLPDIDVVAHAWGSDASLFYRRGITHGVPALVLLPLVLSGAVAWLGRRRGHGDLVRPGPLVALSYLSVLSHPFFDWLNTYGMRWLMPFDDRWFYGDVLFIIDPWLWLFLGGAAFLRFSPTRRAVSAWAAVAVVTTLIVTATGMAPGPTKVAWLVGLALLAAARAVLPRFVELGRLGENASLAGIGAVVCYLVLVTGLNGRANDRIVAILDEAPHDEIFVGPLPGRTLTRDIVVSDHDSYVWGRLRWEHYAQAIPELESGGSLPIHERPDDPLHAELIDTALDARCVRGMVAWLRFPYYRVVGRPEGGHTVVLGDARYVRGGTEAFGIEGFGPATIGIATVRLDADGAVVGCGG